MLLSAFSRVFRNPVPYRCFSIFDSNYYDKVVEDALTRREIRHRRVKVKTTQKGPAKEIDLYGIPVAPLEEREGGIHTSIQSFFTGPTEDITFIQVDPTRYIHNYREFTLKNESQEQPLQPQVKEALKSDPVFPYSWDECLLSPEVLTSFITGKNIKFPIKGEKESSNTQETSKEFEDLTKVTDKLAEKIEDMTEAQAEAFASEVNPENTDLIGGVVRDHVLDGHQLDYYELNNILYYSIIMGNTVVFGNIPKLFKRLMLGNTLRVENLRKLFETVVQSYKEVKAQRPNITLSDLTVNSFPEIFVASDIIYMIVLLKEIAKANSTGLRAFVGIDYVEAIADQWTNPDVEGYSLSDIVGVTHRQEEDTVETVLEKQAILDVLFGDDLWNLPYLKNRLPFLTENELKEKSVEEWTEEYNRYKGDYYKKIDEEPAEERK